MSAAHCGLPRVETLASMLMYGKFSVKRDVFSHSNTNCPRMASTWLCGYQRLAEGGVTFRLKRCTQRTLLERLNNCKATDVRFWCCWRCFFRTENLARLNEGINKELDLYSEMILPWVLIILPDWGAVPCLHHLFAAWKFKKEKKKN